MNQDNQVGWEKDFFERWGRSGLWARETGKAYNTGDGISNVYTTDVLRDVHYFIAAVAQDSYAEGIRRARKRVEAYDKSGTWNELVILSPRQFAAVMIDDLTKLEEEVKK